MNKTLMAAVLVAATTMIGLSAHAADASAPTKTLTPQQQKMKDCNAEAKTKALKGADRKAFMKTCLSGSSAAPAAASAKSAQQQKMKDCNAQAKTKGLSGADRKSFMSTCLKGS